MVTRTTRRALLVGAMCVLLAAAGATAYVRTRDSCGQDVTSVSAANSQSPFLDADGQRQEPDHHRDTLVRTLAADPAPVGAVVGAVGYDYGQWAQVSAYAQGIGVRTRDNPDFTMLDDHTLKPRWSVQVDTKHSTYDASDQRYLVATMPSHAAPDLVSLDANNGHRRWCAHLGGATVRGDDPFATQILDDQDVVVLGPASKGQVRVVRLSAKDGALRWKQVVDADAGDFLGDLGGGVLLAGGRPQYRLLDPTDVGRRRAGVALFGLSAKDGSKLWRLEEPSGSDVHVIGADASTGRAVLEEWSQKTRSTRLMAVDRNGLVDWSVVAAQGKPYDAALRNGRVLLRAGNRWWGYSLEDGHRLWTRTVPTRPQFLPYGFTLDDVPLLDFHHALVGGTTALHTLDLDTGQMTDARLPTDGISTTYWPYQVAVSDGLIAIATNTAAVVVRRE